MIEANRADLREKLGSADLNVLRMAVVHATGDRSLLELTPEPVLIRGGAFTGYRVPPQHAELVRDRAIDVLLGDDGPRVDPSERPSLRDLMTAFTGEGLSDHEYELGREELSLDDAPRAAHWPTERPPHADEYLVAIVGAGPSGIAAAIQFENLGIPYVVLERQSTIGGTWTLNHYPEARVDTSSFLYQYTFEKNYPWGHYYAPQEDIRRYLETVARKHGIYDRIQFGVEVGSARFEDDSATWVLQTSSRATGATESVRANFLVCASGLFSTPKLPPLCGLESFAGDSFHTAGWPERFSATGKRIALIGNGSTGVQLMPWLAQEAAQLTVFQRTPQWMTPLENYDESIDAGNRWLLDNMPYYWNWYRYALHVSASSMQAAQRYDRQWQATGGDISEENDKLRRSLTGYVTSKLAGRPDLLERSLPDYAPLARRLVIDNGWYDALQRDNVRLVTDPIDEVTPTGIRTGSSDHPVDVVVYATGFHATQYLSTIECVGRDGMTLERLWKADGPRAYLGMTLPHFPNLFIMYGPNAQPRSGAVTTWTEVWSRYIARAIAELIAGRGQTIEVQSSVYDEYNRRLDEESENLIWEREAPADKNYYINEFGRQNVNFPWSNADYFAMARLPVMTEYDLS